MLGKQKTPWKTSNYQLRQYSDGILALAKNTLSCDTFVFRLTLVRQLEKPNHIALPVLYIFHMSKVNKIAYECWIPLVHRFFTRWWVFSKLWKGFLTIALLNINWPDYSFQWNKTTSPHCHYVLLWIHNVAGRTYVSCFMMTIKSTILGKRSWCQSAFVV